MDGGQQEFDDDTQNHQPGRQLTREQQNIDHAFHIGIMRDDFLTFRPGHASLPVNLNQPYEFRAAEAAMMCGPERLFCLEPPNFAAVTTPPFGPSIVTEHYPWQHVAVSEAVHVLPLVFDDDARD